MKFYKTLVSAILVISLVIGLTCTPTMVSTNTSASYKAGHNDVFQIHKVYGLTYGDTLYVDDSNTMGPWDGTDDHPFQRIQQAIDTATVGTLIYVYPGTYRENLVIKSAVKNDISLRGEDEDATVIDGQNTLSSNTIELIDVENIEISHFTITGSSLEFSDTVYLYSAIHCNEGVTATIHDNLIINNGNGIRGEQDSELKITDNTIRDNLCDGILGHAEFEIIGNTIENNGFGEGPSQPNGDGISLWSASENSIIQYNYIIGNRIDGIWDEGVDNHIIEHNIISSNGQSGIHFDEGRDCKISNNTITGNGFSSDILFYQGYGILLTYSTFNEISGNIIEENKHGIHLKHSQFNDIKNNYIQQNTNFGIWLADTSNGYIGYNKISYNNVGIYIQIDTMSQITRNDICYNKACELLAILAMGIATYNYWGSVWGPWATITIRLPPPLPIVMPYAKLPNFPDEKQQSYPVVCVPKGSKEYRQNIGSVLSEMERDALLNDSERLPSFLMGGYA